LRDSTTSTHYGGDARKNTLDIKRIRLPWLLSMLQPLDFPHKLGICERLFGKRLNPHGICWVKTAANIEWKLDLSDSTLRWIVYGKYEGSAFLNWARRFLPHNGIIVDSGANIGQMLLYLAQWVPDGKILAFEPGKEQAEWLEECLAYHPELPVEVIRAALGDKHSQAYLQKLGPPSVHGAWSKISDREGEPVEIVRLTDALVARSIEQVDLWKLDVEGHEVPALMGAESLLVERKIKALYIELAGENGIRVLNYMSKLGYSGYLFGHHGTLQPCSRIPDHSNGLFLHN